MLTPQGCLERRKRLKRVLLKQRCDGAVLSWNKHVYYFGGILPDPGFPCALLMDDPADATLVLPSQPAASAGRVEPYEWLSMVCARRPRDSEFLAAVSRLLKRGRLCGVRRVAVDGGWFPQAVAEAIRKVNPKVKFVDITDDLVRLRQRKDADEVAVISESIRLIEAAYAIAGKVVAVGKSEIEVYQELSAEIDRVAGRHVELKGDFGTGIRGWKEGGMPTPRRIQKGDLYILDLFPDVDGYYGDLTRVFAAGPLHPAQLKAWDVILETIEATEKLIEPGLPGSKVYEFVRQRLGRFKAARAVFFHHAGHGLGLTHEHPRFTPKSDENLVEGSVFTLEPGLYGETLQGGLRIEHNYWLTADGLQKLDGFPTHHA